MPEALPSLPRCLPLSEIDRATDAQDQDHVIAIKVLAPRARYSLRFNLSLLVRSRPVAGFMLDMPINRYDVAAMWTAMRLGPDEWQLSGPESEGTQVAANVGAGLDPLHHALVDISHRHVVLSVSGPRATDVINCACALDLAPSAFPIGAATRTLLGKAEIILSRRDDVPTFEIECARSFSAYLRDLLQEAARQHRAHTRDG